MNRRQFWLPLLAAVLACALGAGAILPAAAQGGGPTGTTFRYSDAQGPGCLTITTQGDDQAGGGAAITVSLAQNGVSWSGQGEEWVTSATAPRTTALAFWLNDGNGTVLFYDGTLKMGVDTLNAQGGWTSAQDTTVNSQWQAFAMFPSRPCTDS